MCMKGFDEWYNLKYQKMLAILSSSIRNYTRIKNTIQNHITHQNFNRANKNNYIQISTCKQILNPEFVAML